MRIPNLNPQSSRQGTRIERTGEIGLNWVGKNFANPLGTWQDLWCQGADPDTSIKESSLYFIYMAVFRIH
jgi:hypothetical protein